MEISYEQPVKTCKVLVVSSHQDTQALLKRLDESNYSPPVALAEEEVCPALDLHFHELNYNAVAIVAREQQGSEPYALVIVDIQASTEANAEQIIGALYHTDLRLHILALLGAGTTPGKALMDVMSRSSRLACLWMPCDLNGLSQFVKLMTVKWSRDQLSRAKEAAAVAPAAAPAKEPDNQVVNLAAIGSLASGIAHEFNNFLTVVQSHMDMALGQAASLPGVTKLLTQVMESARSASHLSRKLVALTPQEVGSPAAIQLDQLVDDEIAMLRKTLGEEIALKADYAKDLPLAWADPAIVSQVITNVAVHAKAAMPGGGTLQFSAAKLEMEEGEMPGVRPGNYVALTIEDPNPAPEGATAAASDQSTEERLTWIQNRLAAGDGAFHFKIVPGFIRRYQMFFPLAQDRAGAAPAAAPVPAGPIAAANPATILVVDDDETICTVMTQVLGSADHRVLTAMNADEGWSQWRHHRGTIKLLITDINMPGGANGVALGQAVQEDDASVPVIYTSGYRAASQFKELIPGANYLPKPFGMNELLTVVTRNLVKHGRHGLA
ncbi:MAG TPA: response regulator [Prosthecobacter sp.]|nr:response regulator [Prosthecobacter sp.]